MITLPQLKALAKQNKIRCTYLNKDEIIALLIDNNIITTSDIFDPKFVVNNENPAFKREVNINKYKHLEGIRNNPKMVEIFDQQTGETSIYTSKYKAGRALKVCPVYFIDGTICKNRYKIKVT